MFAATRPDEQYVHGAPLWRGGRIGSSCLRTTTGSEMIRPDDEMAEAASVHEAEHRARNALQLISALILLQGRQSPDDAVGRAMTSLLSRVAAVSAAHRETVRVENNGQVDGAALIREVVGDLARSTDRQGVVIDLSLEPILVPDRLAAPLALLVNETVSNALRHAFPEGRNGCIQVRLRPHTDGFELCIDDDGSGHPAPSTASGFGLTLIRLMVQQIRGRMQMTALDPGFRVSVTVPLADNPGDS